MKRPRRKAIPKALRLAVCQRQGWLCECGCYLLFGELYGEIFVLSDKGAELDHDPALELRRVNTAGTDYDPPQLDPAFIVARCPASHRKKTSGNGHTSAGSDANRAAKIRHIRGETKQGPKRKMQSRPMPGTRASGIRKRMSGEVTKW